MKEALEKQEDAPHFQHQSNILGKSTLPKLIQRAKYDPHIKPAKELGDGGAHL